MALATRKICLDGYILLLVGCARFANCRADRAAVPLIAVQRIWFFDAAIFVDEAGLEIPGTDRFICKCERFPREERPNACSKSDKCSSRHSGSEDFRQL